MADMLNQPHSECAYSLADVKNVIPPEVATKISAIEGVLTVRTR